MFFNRRLAEYQFTNLSDTLFEEWQQYLEEKSTFLHGENAEYIFWLPDSEEKLMEVYADAPGPIKDIIVEVWKRRNEEIKAKMTELHEGPSVSAEEYAEAVDFGYLLIACL